MNFTSKLFQGMDAASLVHLDKLGGPSMYSSGRLRQQVASLSHCLLDLGVKAGNPVLIIADTSPSSVISILAVWACGAIAIPLSPQSNEQELLSVLESLLPTACISNVQLSERQVAHLSRCCDFLLVPQSNEQHSSVAQYPLSSMLHREQVLPAVPVARDQPVLVVYSSGSQGQPKAMVHTLASLETFFDYFNFHYAQYQRDDRPGSDAPPLVSTLPLNHLGGLGICLMGLMTGRAVYLLDNFQSEQFLELVQQVQPNMLLLLPTMYETLMKTASARALRFHYLDYCITLGEACSDALAQRIGSVFSAIVVSAYGMSECQSGIGYNAEDLADARVKPGSCGRLLYGEVKLLDPNGEVQKNRGELYVKNPTVRPCYLSSVLNQKKFAHGWFRTGDNFYRDAQGYYFHRGRSDNMFVCNGKNIYPADIENIFLKHSGITTLCAAPVVNRAGRSVPAVLIKSAKPLTTSQLYRFFFEEGARHAIPQFFEFAEELPLTGSGKIDRRKSRDILQTAYDRRQKILAGHESDLT